MQDTAQKSQSISTEAIVVKDEQTFEDITLTAQRVLDAVKQFAEEKNQSGNKQLYATLTSSKISLENQSILIEPNNEVQKENLHLIKQDMLDALRNILQNKQTQLEIRVLN